MTEEELAEHLEQIRLRHLGLLDDIKQIREREDLTPAQSSLLSVSELAINTGVEKLERANKKRSRNKRSK